MKENMENGNGNIQEEQQKIIPLLGGNIYDIERRWMDNRRDVIVFISMITGILIPFICWFIVLCGVDPNSFYSDTIATAGILLTMYAPFWAFYGNNRPLKDKLYHFAIIWYYCNTLYQLTWYVHIYKYILY